VQLGVYICCLPPATVSKKNETPCWDRNLNYVTGRWALSRYLYKPNPRSRAKLTCDLRAFTAAGATRARAHGRHLSLPSSLPLPGRAAPLPQWLQLPPSPPTSRCGAPRALRPGHPSPQQPGSAAGRGGAAWRRQAGGDLPGFGRRLFPVVEAWGGGTPWCRLTMSSSPAPPKVWTIEQLDAG
jgi:hypothetical protein